MSAALSNIFTRSRSPRLPQAGRARQDLIFNSKEGTRNISR
jgi:hypothetical protein